MTHTSTPEIKPQGETEWTREFFSAVGTNGVKRVEALFPFKKGSTFALYNVDIDQRMNEPGKKTLFIGFIYIITKDGEKKYPITFEEKVSGESICIIEYWIDFSYK